MNDKTVFRTASATPGLLISYEEGMGWWIKRIMGPENKTLLRRVLENMIICKNTSIKIVTPKL